MKNRLLQIALGVLCALSAQAQFYADVLKDAGPCNPITPIVCPNGVIDALNAVDPDRQNFALLRIDRGSTGAAFIELGYSSYAEAGDIVLIDLQGGGNDLSLGFMDSLRVEMLDSLGNVVDTKSKFDFNNFHILSGNGGVYRFKMQVDSSASHVASIKLSLRGSESSSSDLRVYGASYIHGSSQDDCGPMLADSVYLAQNVNDPENAVTSSNQDYALLSLPSGMNPSALLDLQFADTGSAGDFVGFEIEPNDTSMNFLLMGGLIISVYNENGVLVDEKSDFGTMDLNLVSTTSDRYEIGFNTNIDSSYSINRIRLSVSPTIGLLFDLRIYNGFIYPQGHNIIIQSSTGNNLICSGGSIELAAEDGLSNYIWNTGATSQTITVTEPGIYTVSGELESCIYSASIEILETSFNAEIISYSFPDCGEETGACDMEVSGGTGPFTYSWSNGDTTQDLTNVGAGIYTCVITDVTTGCEEVIYAHISNTDGPRVNIDVTDSDCGASNGKIDLFVTGSAPFTYEWFHGPTTANIDGLAQDTYYVVVTDVNDCITTLSIDVNATSTLELIAEVTREPGCDSTNGSVDLSVTGGSGTYTYSWSTGQATEDLENIGGGIYTVTVTDQVNQCSSELTVAVSYAQGPEILVVEQAQPSCGFNDGAIEIETIPDNSVFVTWSTGDFGTNRIENLGPGIYTVQVEDFSNNGCSSFMVFEIEDPAGRILVGAAIYHDCIDTEELDGEIELTVTGGTAPLEYEWSNGASTKDIEGLAAGAYALSITDAQGCEYTNNYEVDNIENCSNPPCENCPEFEPCTTDVFTPNSDGINDTWVLGCVDGYPNNHMKVYNRWGNLVYEAKPYQNDWDGRYLKTNHMVPDGTYFYTLEFGDENGTSVNGFVVIIR